MPSRISFFLPIMLLGCSPEIEEKQPDSPEPEIEEPVYGEDAYVIDFGSAGETRWFSVNDTVMGGVSSGSLTYADETMLFEGTVSTDSNGGFTSVRSPQEGYDLSLYDRVLIRLKS